MTVLIPAYEPTEKLLALINSLKARTNYRILIIDDGSGQEFEEIFSQAQKSGCIVLHHDKNEGKGSALKTGFYYLLHESEHDKIVCADSDGQRSVDDIIRTADSIDESKREMVLGVRKFDVKVPFKSKFGNSITAFVFKLATGIAIKDTQTGLRGYSYDLLEWLCSVEGNRFEYELNLLLDSKNSGIAIKQISIKTIYDNNNSGTHFRPVHDSISVMMPIIKFSGSSFTAGVIDFILLFVFNGLIGNLFLSVVLARMISSAYNYTINKMIVFKAKNVSHAQSAPKYFGLVFIIMMLNYSLLACLINIIGTPDVAAKLLTELILFILSYTIQRLFVFRKNNYSAKSVD